MRHKLSVLTLVLIAPAYAQQNGDTAVMLQRILDRLDHLEQENRELSQQVKSLRQELEASRNTQPAETVTNTDQKSASLEDRVAVNETRTAEQAQTKVEAAHKYPIQLTGLVLFNAFSNRRSNNSAVYEYNLLPDSYGSGATMRQTLLGFNFQGPQLPGDGHVNGSLTMDFWGGSAAPGSNWFRLREAYVSLDWKNRSFTVGQEKPLIAPYAPNSLAEVGIPPLAGAGNLWYWLPQIRYEERIALGSSSGIKAQAAELQTGGSAYLPGNGYAYEEPLKPALEGRVAFWHRFDDTRKFEIAPGFHVSSIHIDGASLGSRLASLDWLVVPTPRLTITGTAFSGQNVAGLGSLGNAIAFGPNGIPRAVHSSGGWIQFSVPITNRLTWNTFTGLENDNRTDLPASAVVHDWSYASNFMYHLNPSLIIGLEGLQMRTRSTSGVSGVQTRYDLAVGYLF